LFKEERMKERGKKVHPYIPNSVPGIKAEMMKEIGIGSIEELYADIPRNLRLRRKLNLPPPLSSEIALQRHLEEMLSKNETCAENISFLGGGCTRHHVPAVCDEINQRSEFLTAYAGEPYEDHGRFQALFEYQSLMGELLDMDVVNVPTYDWSQAASTSVRMAARMTGRREILVSGIISPERLPVIKNYCHPVVTLKIVKHDPETGKMDLDDLKAKIGAETAGIYFENPAYLGFIEDQGHLISGLARENGALSIVGVDPISLGVLTPPCHYGADIVCGDIQDLGIHMHFGGGLGGFIATRDEEKFVMEYPSRLFGITRTSVEGEYGFGDVAYERTSFAEREEGKEFVGTHAALWGITAAVYLSLIGSKGLYELGKTILQKSQYATKRLSEIEGIKAPRFDSSHFKEFVVDFNATGKKIEHINESLRRKGIFGGLDLSHEFPEFGECSLYCITEVHTQKDIDCLLESLKEILGGGQ
jgi:glycine dehydrogenase subunit 1